MGKPLDAISAQCSTFVHFLRHRGRCLTVMRTGPVGVASVLGRWSERETNCHYRVHAVIRCPPSSCARERADDDDLTRTGGVGVASVLGRRRERERESPTVTIGSMLSSAVRRRRALERGADDGDLTANCSAHLPPRLPPPALETERRARSGMRNGWRERDRPLEEGLTVGSRRRRTSAQLGAVACRSKGRNPGETN